MVDLEQVARQIREDVKEMEKRADSEITVAGGEQMKMKYSFETTERGYVETLEVNGNVYKKNWLDNKDGTYSCDDDEFYEQIEKSNPDMDEEFLDIICDEIDDRMFANDLYDASKLI